MFKKSVVKLAALAMVVVLMVVCLAACSTTLKGTYTSKGLVEQSFTFKDDNVVVVSALGIDAEGTYKIDGDTMIITYSLLGLSYDHEVSFEKKGDTIIIDGTTFVKEK